MPGTEVAEDFLGDARVINYGDDAHGAAADRAAQWVHMPDLANKIAPAFGRQLVGWRRREAGAAYHQLRREAALALAAHFIGVPAIVADHLRAFIRDMLGDRRQEIGRREHLEIAVDFLKHKPSPD